MTAQRWIALVAVMAVAACDGPQQTEGKKADIAANASGGVLGKGPQERVGEIRDRIAHDQGKAVEARADAAEDRADEVRMLADQRADALEKQAKDIRNAARKEGKTLDRQADAIRGR